MTHIPDLPNLWFLSSLYSEEEELSLYSKSASDPMLDFQLAMGEWETAVTLFTDTMNDIQWLGQFRLFLHTAKDGGVAEELLISTFSPPDDEYDGVLACRKLRNLLSGLPSSSKLFTNIETRFVYLRFLSYITHGSNWKNLTPEAIRDIIIDLRQKKLLVSFTFWLIFMK